MAKIISEKTAGGIPVYVDTAEGVNSGFIVGVATGSRDEREGEYGISHLLEHTVFRETKDMDSFEMAKLMEGAGGELNAFTSKEVTAYFGVTLKETSDVAMRCVGDIVSSPKISEKDTELEKSIVLQELSMLKSEPEAYIHSLFEENLWKGDILGMDEGGFENTVEGLTYENLRNYYGERYGRPNLKVFATGEDPEVVVDWAERCFDPMEAAVVNERKPPAKASSGLEIKDNGNDHCQIGFGFPLSNMDEESRMAAHVVASVLGAGTSSRLFQRVREKNALVYSVYMSEVSYSDAGYVGAFMSCTEGNVVKTMDETAAAIREFTAEGLKEGELRRTKNILKGAVARSSERTSGRLYHMCVGGMTRGKVMSTEQRFEAIDAVTEDDVMRIAGELFSPDDLSVTILGKVGRDVRDYEPCSLEFRSRRNWSIRCITALSAEGSAALTGGVRSSLMVCMSSISTATNFTDRGMVSGSIFRPIFSAVGMFMSCAGTWPVTASSKSSVS